MGRRDRIERMSALKESAMPGETRWENLNVAFMNYRLYIDRKTDKNALTLVDLLYIRNFKAGNSSITDPEQQVSARLIGYSEILAEIRGEFGESILGRMSDDQLQGLIEKTVEFINLPLHAQTEIRGFGPSYASAMLAAHFPDLIPIIDRNVLLGIGIIGELNNDQVDQIEQHYGPLLTELHQRMKAAVPHTKLRDLDRQLFIDGSKMVKALGGTE